MLLLTRRCIRWIVAIGLSNLLGLLHPDLILLPVTGIFVLFGLTIWDWIRLARFRAITLERRWSPTIQIGSAGTVELIVSNSATVPVNLEIYQEVAPGMGCTLQPVQLCVPSGCSQTVTQEFRPTERGEFAFGVLRVRVSKVNGLVIQETTVRIDGTVKVYPKCRADHGNTAVLKDREEHTARQAPATRVRAEIAGLRPYAQGDSLRCIDWKVSGRRGSLVSREYREESGQQVAVLVDCGRRMAERIDGLTRLDHALNAAAQLARATEACKDSFSFLAFSNRVEAVLPPQRGHSIVPKFVERAYQLQSSPVESDYWQVVGQVMHQLNKRSLIVLFTDLLDAAGCAGMIRNLSRAATKHRVLCVVMRDQYLDAAAKSESGWKQGAACYLAVQRSRALQTMRSRGIVVLEVTPQAFTADLIQSYLQLREEV